MNEEELYAVVGRLYAAFHQRGQLVAALQREQQRLTAALAEAQSRPAPPASPKKVRRGR